MRKLALKAAFVAGFAAASLAWSAPAVAQTATADAACAPVGGLSFICNVTAPEDLKVIPGTTWMIASGMVEGQGLKLIDTAAKRAMDWDTGPHHSVQHNRTLYPACSAPIERARYNSHGLSLRRMTDGRYTLLVVAHGGRESIEIYTVDPRPAVPTLTWNGCLIAPEGHRFNSVTSFEDGEVLATVPTLPGSSTAESAAGRPSGAIFQWKPGQTSFRRLPGTDLPGPNGIEASKDGKEFFVVAFGARQVVAFERGDNPKIARRSPTLHFLPDNIAFDSGDRLIAAGSVFDEPACGGKRRIVDGVVFNSACNRGHVAAQFDPVTLDHSILSYGEANPVFGGVAAAVVVDDEIWLASFRADRLAWRKLPRPAP